MAQKLVTVTRGTTVEWINNGRNIHTISSLDGIWESPALRRGDTYAFTFKNPGSYRYICSEHILNGMSGTINVE